MEESQKKMLRDYAWKYFALHAEQRMKTFHFYVLVSSVLIAGFINGIKDSDSYLLFSVMGLLLAFISFLFGKLDERNKILIRNGEEAIKFLDNLEDLDDTQEKPSVCKIFAHDDLTMKKKFSYSSFFNAMFFIFGSLGIFATAYCIVEQYFV